MIVNDNRVCPRCGGYSQGEGSGYCTNGHFVEEKDWTSSENVDEKAAYVLMHLIPDSISMNFVIMEVTQSRAMYWNKYDDAEDCAELHIKCKDKAEGEFYINMYYGIGHKDGETKTIITVNEKISDGVEQYGNTTDDNSFCQVIDIEINQYLQGFIDENQCHVYSAVETLDAMDFIVFDKKINRKNPSIQSILELEKQLAEAKALYKKSPELIRHYENNYEVTAKFLSDEVDEVNKYLESKNHTEGVITQKNGYIYIARMDDKGVKGKKRLYFKTVKEGYEQLVAFYAAESETTGGEFVDALLDNKENEFHDEIPFPIIMGAVQEFRSWDVGDENELYAEVHMVPDGCGNWENDFLDYQYEDGSYVPAGTRVGYENGNGLMLDKGISIANVDRSEEDTNE